jgi:phospholipase C
MAVASQADGAVWRAELKPGQSVRRAWSFASAGGWYDLTVRIEGEAGYLRRLAGRLENGKDSFSDPLMGGPALMER